MEDQVTHLPPDQEKLKKAWPKDQGRPTSANQPPSQNGLAGFWFAANLVAYDQAFKYFATHGWPSSLAHSGSGFGAFYNDKSILWALVASALVAVLMVWRLKGHLKPKQQRALTLIIAGGLSNMIDYLQLQAIIDTFGVASLHFNLADCYIVVGSSLFIYSLLKGKRHNLMVH